MCLNKALPKRKGNVVGDLGLEGVAFASMKALPKRKGNADAQVLGVAFWIASMKALPKRKGNLACVAHLHRRAIRLNESPSKKEGKSTE